MAADNALMNGMVRALYDNVPGTNIPLEGLLALIKSSVGPRQHPTAEKLGHMGLFTQLLKRHVDAGLPDMHGKLSQSDLIAKGVPSRANKQCIAKRASAPRYHIAYANAKMRSWHQLNPHAQCDAAVAARKAAIAEWSSGLGEIARQEFIDSVKQSKLADEEAADDAVTQESVHRAPSIWQMCVGSGEWPLKEEHIERVLSTQGQATPGPHYGVHSGGIHDRFKHRHWKASRDLVIEKQEYIPDKNMSVPLCCREAHPGVCLTRDAANFREIVMVAADLEHFFTKEWCGRFCRVFPKRAALSGSGCFITLAHRRGRRPRIHVTHAFVALHLSGSNLRFEGDADYGFEFMSQYGLAKKMVDAMPGFDCVHVE